MVKWVCKIFGHAPIQMSVKDRKFTRCTRCKQEWEGWEEHDLRFDPTLR